MLADSQSRRERRVLAALVGVACLTAFAPALDNGFVDWDDHPYLVENPWIRGLGVKNIAWMLTAVRGGLWQPLTWLSFAIDHSLWGLEPCGYHLTGVLLHAVNSVLLFVVCLRLFKRSWPAALASLFFGVHPLRVESVAWATERKGLLAAFFWLASLWTYLEAAARGGRRRWTWEAASLASFALSLCAKVSGVTLPIVLLILDLYRGLRPRWRALAPYVLLAGAGFLVNLAAAMASDVSLNGPESLGLGWSMDRAFYGLVFYPIKTLWPSELAPYYPPRPWFGRWSVESLGLAALVAVSIAAVFRFSRRRPAVGAVFACYMAAWAPMSGFFQHGLAFAACDRFSYLPCLSLSALFGAAFAGARPAARLVAAAWLAALGAAAWTQCGVWHDSLALWSAAAAREPSALAEGNLAAALSEEKRYQEALPFLRRAIEADPGLAVAYEDHGVALHLLGREEEARSAWRKGLARGPAPAIAARLGASLGDAALLRAAVLQCADCASWRADLADALAVQGRVDEAEDWYAQALSLDGSLGVAHNNWGLLLAARGRSAEAAEQYRAALACPSSRAQAHYNWGNLHLAQGRPTEAERHYREALRLAPGLAEAEINWGNLLARRGELARAVAHYRAALRLRR